MVVPIAFHSKIVDTHVRWAKLCFHECIYGHSSVWYSIALGVTFGMAIFKTIGSYSFCVSIGGKIGFTKTLPAKSPSQIRCL